MVDSLSSGNSSFRSVTASNSDKNREIVESAQKLIMDNLERDFSLSDIVEHIGLSPDYFSKIFKENTGESYLDFMTKKRMETAREMILSTNMKVEDIGMKVGFKNPAYFIKKFREAYGLTPKGLKRKQALHTDPAGTADRPAGRGGYSGIGRTDEKE